MLGHLASVGIVVDVHIGCHHLGVGAGHAPVGEGKKAGRKVGSGEDKAAGSVEERERVVGKP